jgi:hypothetical protein
MFMLFSLAYLMERNLTMCRELSGLIENNIKDGVDIEDKINFIIKIVSACSRGTELILSPFIFILPLISSFLFGIIIPALIYKLVQLPNYFFLLFTEESKKMRDIYFRGLKNKQKFWGITIVASVMIGTITGVAGNFIYSFLIKLFGG